MRENRTSGSEGGEAQTNELSLPLSPCQLAAAGLPQSGRTLRGPNKETEAPGGQHIEAPTFSGSVWLVPD